MLQPFHTFTEYHGASEVIKTLIQREAIGIISDHDKAELDELIERRAISFEHLKTQHNGQKKNN